MMRVPDLHIVVFECLLAEDCRDKEKKTRDRPEEENI